MGRDSAAPVTIQIRASQRCPMTIPNRASQRCPRDDLEPPEWRGLAPDDASTVLAPSSSQSLNPPSP